MARKGATPQEQAARDARLLAIARDLLASPDITQTMLAERYGVSQQQISQDVRLLKRRWQESALSKTDERIALQDAQYKALIGAHWTKAMEGKGFDTDRVLQAMSQQAKLLGLEQPAKQQIDLDGGVRLEIVGMADEDLP